MSQTNVVFYQTVAAWWLVLGAVGTNWFIARAERAWSLAKLTAGIFSGPVLLVAAMWGARRESARVRRHR